MPNDQDRPPHLPAVPTVVVPARTPTGPHQVVLSNGHRPSGSRMLAVRDVASMMAREGRITPQQAIDVNRHMGEHGLTVDETLVELGFLTEGQLVSWRSDKYKAPVIDLSRTLPQPEALAKIPFEMAMRLCAIPLVVSETSITIVIADPGDVVGLDDLMKRAGVHNIHSNVASQSDIKRALGRYYGQMSGQADRANLTTAFDQAVDGIEVTTDRDDAVDPKLLEHSAEEAPVVKLVFSLLTTAMQRGASDIHIEPGTKEFRIRFRIDGALYELERRSMKLLPAIVSRIKVMCKLDITERRLTQDGRMHLKLPSGRECDFRVSVLPTRHGEKVVLRLLDKGNLQTDMTKLGFEPAELDKFMKAIHRPHGIVLVTGPTGSGKTTTLYSALTELNKSTENISTVEDPVEFDLPDANQVEVKENIGVTFATSLRALLRQDPDVIMVGEIRDFETAEMAIKAALTGHLVLSTLHTNDAVSTIGRLTNLGVEAFLLASALNMVVAQRLVRRVCQECKKPQILARAERIEAGISELEHARATFYIGTGCTTCNHTGFKGRIAIYEILPMTESIANGIIQGSSAADLKRLALSEGMQTLRRSGLKKAMLGLTTLAEVLRITHED